MIVFLSCSLVSFSQKKYSFLSPSSKEVRGKEYLDFINENLEKSDSIQKSTSRFLENGMTYNQKYADSIFKTKGGHVYTTKFYRDTITNHFSYILYKRSDEEMKKENAHWKQQFKEDEKTAKN